MTASWNEIKNNMYYDKMISRIARLWLWLLTLLMVTAGLLGAWHIAMVILVGTLAANYLAERQIEYVDEVNV